MRTTTHGGVTPPRLRQNNTISGRLKSMTHRDHFCAIVVALLLGLLPTVVGATTRPSQANPAAWSQAALADRQLFVDHTASGANNGSSWDNAFTSLQDALTWAAVFAPSESVDIWVAQGVYFPDVGAGLTNNNRRLSFKPAANVAMYGGFAGTESTREQRDWDANPTVLSGDIDGNDSVDANGVALSHADIIGNNSYHVVLLNKINGVATLDGFTITSGKAIGAGILSGVATDEGAGLHSFNSSANLLNLRIQGNYASDDGGGIFADSSDGRSDMLDLQGVELIANSGRAGGGLNLEDTYTRIFSTAFLHNEATIGGAVRLAYATRTTVRDSVFRGNSASENGGAIWGFNSHVAFVNCEITGNHADVNGGAFYENQTNRNVHSVFTNTVISGNSADGAGGGIHRVSGIRADTRLYNSIIWNNQDSSGVGTASANHGGPGKNRLVGVNSLVQGIAASGSNNLDGTLPANNPLFQQSLDPDTAPSIAGDFRLQPNSPVIDQGNNQARINVYWMSPTILLEGNVLTDLGGNPRIVDGDSNAVATVDLGPYEVAAYTIGGSVSALTGDGLILQNNAGDDLTIADNGSFTFQAPMPDLSSYVVTVLSQPTLPSQTCTVSNGSGSVSSADVTNIAVNCTTDTHIVAGAVGSGRGAITPATQNVEDGQLASLTVTQDTGWHTDIVTGCDGSLDGTTYTTDVITADCSVTANFAIDTFTVTPSVSGSNGTIDPATPQSVDYATTTSFTLTADAGYRVVTPVAGTCAGSLSGGTYTTDPVTADCTVIVSYEISQHTVTPSVAGGNGSIDPGIVQTVLTGSTINFTLTPAANYHVESVTGTCDGALSGADDTIYTTTAVVADCTVVASFAIDRYTVTPGVAGGNGMSDPASPQTVDHGATPSFTLTPDARHHVDKVVGSCGGSLAGNVYTTNTIRADCDVVASFAFDTFSVGGTISGLIGSDLVLRINGSDPLLVTQNGAFVFANPLDDLSSYAVTIAQQPASPNQVCAITDGDGAIDGSNISNVAVVCADTTPQLSVSVTDNNDYALYGKLINYIVTVTNNGNGDATGISVNNLSPPQLDAAFTSWTCSATGVGTTCGSGTGALNDSGVTIPIGRSLSWLVSAPVLVDAPGDSVDYTVNVGGPSTDSATDNNFLVIFRSGFDAPYGNGVESIFEPANVCIYSRISERFDLKSTYSVQLDTIPARSPIDTVILAHDSRDMGFRIERLNLGAISQIRSVTLDSEGAERAGKWHPVAVDTKLLIAAASSGGKRVLLVEGADASWSQPLPRGMDASVTLSTFATTCD